MNRTVGRFRIEALLGSGGMGEVYRAWDTALQRPVAIKRMFWREASAAADRSLFLREGQRASSLSHPNIAAIYDVIEEKDDVLLVMEYVSGTTLRDQLGATIPLDRFFSIALQCVDALRAAHERGILHGDVKPENIMITPAGQVKLLDFGVARRLPGANAAWETATTQTLTGRRPLAGTPMYMAPEVLRGETPDARADIFALGIVLYEMLAGRHPFQGANVTVTTAEILNEREATMLNRSTLKIPARLATVVSRALMKDPARRYASTDDLRKDLEVVQGGGRPSRGAGRSRTRWIWYAATAVVFLGFLALLAGPLARTWWRGRARAQAGAKEAARLAVLPPRVDGTSPELTAFADGLSATVAAKLATLSQNHDLQVINSTRVEHAQATAPGQAMQTLGANVTLQMVVQQSQRMNRVDWILTGARSGQVLADHTLTAPVSDPFTLQDRVADGVIRALQITLLPDEKTALLVHGTTEPAAYDYYLEGHGYLESPLQPGNVTNAVEVLNQALQLDPNFGRAWAERGKGYWFAYGATKQASWVEKARLDCQHAVSLGNAGAEGHVCMGLIDAGTGHYAEATDEYQKAIELDPSAERAYTGLADAYARMNRIADAENAYRQAIAANPNSALAYERLGAFCLQQAEYAKAEDVYKKAIHLAPENFIDYSNLGAADLYMGRYSDAIAALEQSIRLHPAAGAYANLGTAYYQAGRFAEAAHNYAIAVHYNERDPDMWGNLADAYHFSGQQAKAVAASRKQLPLLQDLLRVNPRDAERQGDIASCYAELGEKQQAEAHLAQSLELGRGDKDLLFNAAVVYNDLGETGEALEWLHKSLLAGYSASIVRDSPEFNDLRRNPQFQQLLSQALVQ